jgi:cell wall-associated NlpC family hydrolase
MQKLDPRLHAVREDLADIQLQGQVNAPKFITPVPAQVHEPIVSVYRRPGTGSMQVTQALMGERAKVFTADNDWAWVQLERDNYVGYVKASSLTAQLTAPTHRVAVPSTFLYPEANLKTQPAAPITLNAVVTVTGNVDRFSQISDGRFVFTDHLTEIAWRAEDFVSVAEMFRNVPYYWGGKSVHGLDCSGLVQLSLEASGREAPRDSDLQEATVGTKLMINDLDSLKRGDLVFWNGHVGIMTDPSTLLHANGHHMMVVAEPIREAVDRIAARYGQITSIKRFQ